VNARAEVHVLPAPYLTSRVPEKAHRWCSTAQLTQSSGDEVEVSLGDGAGLGVGLGLGDGLGLGLGDGLGLGLGLGLGVGPGLGDGVGLGDVDSTVRRSQSLSTPVNGSPKTLLLQSTPSVNVRGAVHVFLAPYRTSLLPEKEHRSCSAAQRIHVCGPTLRCSQRLTVPLSGSPKTPFVQSTPSVKARPAVHVPSAPYLTSRIPENSQRLPSSPHGSQSSDAPLTDARGRIVSQASVRTYTCASDERLPAASIASIE
jgi:hypothetical protein